MILLSQGANPVRADVMPGFGVLLTRVAQASDEFQCGGHRRPLSIRWKNKGHMIARDRPRALLALGFFSSSVICGSVCSRCFVFAFCGCTTATLGGYAGYRNVSISPQG